MKLPSLSGVLVQVAVWILRMVPARQTIGDQFARRIRVAAQFLTLRRVEVLAFGLPFALLIVVSCAPAVTTALAEDASIANVAAVQGAVTGLSLIALVFAVEVALRQRDRDDTVYEIMLSATRLRPTFVLAISALLATILAMALSEFGLAQSKVANRLLCAYVLTGTVSVVLLTTVLRTMRVLRPTSVIGYRVRANEDERRRRIEQFIATRRENADTTETPQ